MATKSGKGAGSGRRSGETTEPLDAPVGLSHPQEIDFFDVRAGREWTPVEVDRAVRTLKNTISQSDKEAAVGAWLSGQSLHELYTGWAERVKQARSFVEWASATFDLPPPEIRTLLRIYRRLPNADAAHGLGKSIMLLGFRLMDRLNIETLETLRTKTWTLADGTTVAFPDTRVRLEKLIATLALAEAKAEEPTGPARLLSEAKRRNAALDVARAEDPMFEGVTARYVVRDGVLVLRAGTLNSTQAVAVAKLILKLERER